MMKTILYYFLIVTFSNYLHGQSEFKNYSQKLENSTVSFEMIAVLGGTFEMGNKDFETLDRPNEGPAKIVEVSPFWMGAHEVTYDEYQLFFEEDKDPSQAMDGFTRPSPPYIDFTVGMGKSGGYPANSMQQYAALMYCKWLYKRTGVFYRLPTEAEWEHAAKIGFKDIDLTDENILDQYVWYAGNAQGKYQKVKQKKPNKLGIYDMLGNVAEWTLDQYVEDYFEKISDGQKDPLTPKTKKHPCTIKGGFYESELNQIRPSYRSSSEFDWNRRDPQVPKSKWWNSDSPFVGFRLVRPKEQPSKEDIDIFFENYLKW